MQIGDFLTNRPTQQIAASLLGQKLVYRSEQGRMSAWITETEAYLGTQDAGAHAFKNHQTKRNQALWQAAGTIYIYQMRTQFLLNLVTQAAGVPECVLIRGIEPASGLAQMQTNRPVPLSNLTTGPGKLMQALGLDKTLNGCPLSPETLTIDFSAARTPIQIGHSARIGILNKADWSTAPLRYYVAGNPFVSQIHKRDIDTSHHGWR